MQSEEQALEESANTRSDSARVSGGDGPINAANDCERTSARLTETFPTKGMTKKRRSTQGREVEAKTREEEGRMKRKKGVNGRIVSIAENNSKRKEGEGTRKEVRKR